MQPQKLTFRLNWCWGKAPKWLLSGRDTEQSKAACCTATVPTVLKLCWQKRKDARRSTVCAVWCYTINPGKWADNGSFWLLLRLWLTPPRMNLLKNPDSATITHWQTWWGCVWLSRFKPEKNCFSVMFWTPTSPLWRSFMPNLMTLNWNCAWRTVRHNWLQQDLTLKTQVTLDIFP